MRGAGAALGAAAVLLSAHLCCLFPAAFAALGVGSAMSSAYARHALAVAAASSGALGLSFALSVLVRPTRLTRLVFALAAGLAAVLAFRSPESGLAGRAAGLWALVLLAAALVVRRREPEAVDPVCGMRIRVRDARESIEHGGATYHFCLPVCARRFREEPERYAGGER